MLLCQNNFYVKNLTLFTVKLHVLLKFNTILILLPVTFLFLILFRLFDTIKTSFFCVAKNLLISDTILNRMVINFKISRQTKFL